MSGVRIIEERDCPDYSRGIKTLEENYRTFNVSFYTFYTLRYWLHYFPKEILGEYSHELLFEELLYFVNSMRYTFIDMTAYSNWDNLSVWPTDIIN